MDTDDSRLANAVNLMAAVMPPIEVFIKNNPRLHLDEKLVNCLIVDMDFKVAAIKVTIPVPDRDVSAQCVSDVVYMVTKNALTECTAKLDSSIRLEKALTIATPPNNGKIAEVTVVGIITGLSASTIVNQPMPTTLYNNVDNIEAKVEYYMVFRSPEIESYRIQIRELLQEYERLKKMQSKRQNHFWELESDSKTPTHRPQPEVESRDEAQGWRKRLWNRSDRHTVIKLTQQALEVPDVIPRAPVDTTSIGARFTQSIDLSTGANDLRANSTVKFSRSQSIPNYEHREYTYASQTPVKQLNVSYWLVSTDAVHDSTDTQHGLADTTQYMADHTSRSLIHDILVREWANRPGNMCRTEFLYHVLNVFVTHGVRVSHPSSTRLFEANVSIIKEFMKRLNVKELVVIEVELLIALENLAYSEPMFRSTIGELMYVLLVR
ncbi:unnamed protein product, partial [Oppiella nova]